MQHRPAGAGPLAGGDALPVGEEAGVGGLVDRLHLMICPEIAGGGPRLFDDGLPGSKWAVTHQEIGEPSPLPGLCGGDSFPLDDDLARAAG